MVKNHPDSNTEQNLKQLETHIDELIAAYDRLREENKRLRTKQKAHAAERVSLIEKRDAARAKAEQMLNRVKTMEDPHE
ncbi:MAG: TIGR02449 family protein [Gammaproteobacteria bacterium]|nr:TIGR02449 family protein [Gammaproteobacteria bacterium]